MFQNIGEMVLLFWRTLKAFPLLLRQRQKVFDQFFEIGNASLLMVCVLSFFIGGVLALQTGPVLVERGLASAVGGLVGISIAKELAPVMMSILIAGRIGSAMAAEIGSMQVYQEIDALRNHEHQSRALPCAATHHCHRGGVADARHICHSCGLAGRSVVAFGNDRIALSFAAFFTNLREVVELNDVANGVFKSFCFALIIGVVSCHQGLVTIAGRAVSAVPSRKRWSTPSS
jgi:phospholipid/cholesterol/gamma-HCH transport system permease protein